ncbi:MAG: paraquat-inducible protein A [Thermodesulfobacteriota bacterium]|nr:paraquat-inducible protein A [Thermodesulfobacteriota bacterium]
MSSLKVHINDLLACPDCDLLLEQRHLEPGRKACCPRCGHVLYAPKRNSVDKTLALALTGLILFIPANFLPIMTLDTMGFKQAGSIFDGIRVIYESGYFFVALIVGLTSFAFPFVKLFLLFYVSLHLKLKRYPHDLPLFMRWYRHLDEWGMLEVYMIGILVAIIKLHHIAHIHYDFGFFCFIALLFVALASSVSMDKHEFWERIEEKPA